jgi:hypothetical protein
LESFKEIFIGTNVNIVLVQDVVNEVRITGGENLVNFIGTDITDDVLRIENNNRCNFLRSYKHEITVEIHFVELREIMFEGTKPLLCASTISGNNLTVVVRDGAGLIDLDVDYNNITYIITNGWGNFDISGTTNTLILDVSSNGFGSTYDLEIANELTIKSKTAGILKVNADNANCVFNLESVGDIWYIGNPTTLDIASSGDGEVINKN